MSKKLAKWFDITDKFFEFDELKDYKLYNRETVS